MTATMKKKTYHAIYLSPENLRKVKSVQEKMQKENQMKVSFNATINKIIEDRK